MDRFEQIHEDFHKKYNTDFSLEFYVFNEEKNYYDFIIRINGNNGYVSVVIDKGVAYIHMMQVSEGLQGRGIGTKLFESVGFVSKNLGATLIGGDITNLFLLKIFNKIFGKDRLKIYKRTLGISNVITYEEAENMLLPENKYLGHGTPYVYGIL